MSFQVSSQDWVRGTPVAALQPCSEYCSSRIRRVGVGGLALEQSALLRLGQMPHRLVYEGVV